MYKSYKTTIMKGKINNLFNAATAGLLSLLGFSSCSNTSGDSPCLYGSPTSDYHFKGTVTDEQGTPINGIKVVTQEKYGDVTLRLDSTYTDSNGTYQTADKTTVNAQGDVTDRKLFVGFEDVDGTENGGEFETAQSVGSDISVKQISKGDNGWYKGKFEFTADKKLKKK